jgi:YD repeat-containing protein
VEAGDGYAHEADHLIGCWETDNCPFPIQRAFENGDEMKKTTLLTLLTLALLTGAASAQSRTFYDASGKVVGRSSTDSQGTVTNYDARGRVISRESTSGNTTVIYDAGGRNVGRVTTAPLR